MLEGLEIPAGEKAHTVRDSGAGLQEVMTVQTYHVALALAHHGVGVAMVEACTAASADPMRVPSESNSVTVTSTAAATRPPTFCTAPKIDS